MEKNSTFVEPYKPSRIHKFFSWIDRLPGPYWLFYIGLVVIMGLLNHIVAWNENLVLPGEINWYYAFTALFLAYFLFETDFLLRVAKETLVEFFTILDISKVERERILFEFTHLPAIPTAVVFWVGTSIGFGIAWSIFPTAIEMNNTFPELELPVFTLSFATACIITFVIIRAYMLTIRVYDKLKTINIFDLSSLYTMPKYSVLMLVFLILQFYLLLALNPSLIDISFQFFLFWFIVLVVLLFIFLWFPVRRVNRILVLEKRRLLTDVNLRIETTFGLLHTRVDQQEYKQIGEIREALQSLMIEKEFVGSLRTWPWHPRTFRGLLSLVFAPILLDLLGTLLSNFIKN